MLYFYVKNQNAPKCVWWLGSSRTAEELTALLSPLVKGERKWRRKEEKSSEGKGED